MKSKWWYIPKCHTLGVSRGCHDPEHWFSCLWWWLLLYCVQGAGSRLAGSELGSPTQVTCRAPAISVSPHGKGEPSVPTKRRKWAVRLLAALQGHKREDVAVAQTLVGVQQRVRCPVTGGYFWNHPNKILQGWFIMPSIFYIEKEVRRRSSTHR